VLHKLNYETKVSIISKRDGFAVLFDRVGWSMNSIHLSNEKDSLPMKTILTAVAYSMLDSDRILL